MSIYRAFLLSVLALTACAPFEPQVTCDTVLGPFHFQGATDCAVAESNAKLAAGMLTAMGLPTPGLDTWVLEVKNFPSVGSPGQMSDGRTWFGMGADVELGADGRALLHEVLHVVGGPESTGHDGWESNGWLAAADAYRHCAPSLREPMGSPHRPCRPVGPPR